MDQRPNTGGPRSSAAHSINIDCRGMQCPAPILQVAKAARQAASQQALLHVYADDGDFPADLEAWCRAAHAQLRWSTAPEAGVYHGIVSLNGAPLPTRDGVGAEPTSGSHEPVSAATRFRTSRAAPAPAPRPQARQAASAATSGSHAPAPRSPPSIPPRLSEAVPPQPPPRSVDRSVDGMAAAASPPRPGPRAHPEPSPEPAGDYPTLNLRGVAPHVAILSLTEVLRESPRGLRVISDDPEFRTSLYAWASATRAEVRDVQQWDRNFSAMVTLPHDVSTALPPREASQAGERPHLPVLSAEVQRQAVPRENLATILVLHNDLECLLGAMMTANACAAQGMEVVMFFSFWGVNVLRGPNPHAIPEPKGLMQRMMQWMMPRGPRRQRLGKMDMGGMGTAMMQSFMRQQHVMPLEEMMHEAIELGVRFQVCTMSMSVMGIQKSDLMDLPNMEYLGVASFAESARKSALSLTF